MPSAPSRASDDSAQLARSSHHAARSLVFGVRKNAALRANRPSTDARATTRDVNCQMKNAPIDRAWPDQTVADDLVAEHARLRIEAELAWHQIVVDQLGQLADDSEFRERP